MAISLYKQAQSGGKKESGKNESELVKPKNERNGWPKYDLYRHRDIIEEYVTAELTGMGSEVDITFERNDDDLDLLINQASVFGTKPDRNSDLFQRQNLKVKEPFKFGNEYDLVVTKRKKMVGQFTFSVRL